MTTGPHPTEPQFGQWQPIETARKYGVRLIIYDPNYWGKNQGHVGEGRHLGLGDRWHFFQFPQGTANPTLWMPLPVQDDPTT